MSDGLKHYPDEVHNRTPPTPIDPADTEAMSAHRDSLFKRLEQGYERLEEGLRDGQDVTTWEDYWVILLTEYEKVCAELQQELADGP